MQEKTGARSIARKTALKFVIHNLTLIMTLL